MKASVCRQGFHNKYANVATPARHGAPSDGAEAALNDAHIQNQLGVIVSVASLPCSAVRLLVAGSR